VASVARRHGSLPMSGTAKMLVTAGGARVGTVGGGCLEAEITERALDVAERREPVLARHTLNAELAGDYGLTCGGTVDLVIEPVFVDETLADVYEVAIALLARGGRGILVTGRRWTSAPAKALLSDDGLVGGASPTLIAAARRFAHDREAPALRRDGLLEAVASSPSLTVFGAGHVGRAIARVASSAGWRVTVVDDRSEYADATRLPFADSVVCCDFNDVGAVLPLGAASYCVVATRGHQHDALIVEQLLALPLPLRYLGMLGSRRKAALTRDLLMRAGTAAERLDTMRAPVGLPIGADTPEEIAVSVVAEMIAERRRGTRRRGGVVAMREARR
jgi:xanthine dehydrogenase accessory factor